MDLDMVVTLNTCGREVNYKMVDDLQDVSNLIKIARDFDGDIDIDSTGDLNDANDVETLFAFPQFIDLDDESEDIVRFNVNSLFYQMVSEWFGFKATDGYRESMDAVDELLQCTSFKEYSVKYMALDSIGSISNLYNRLLPLKYREGNILPNEISNYFLNQFIKNDLDENNPVEKARQKMVNDIRKGVR